VFASFQPAVVRLDQHQVVAVGVVGQLASALVSRFFFALKQVTANARPMKRRKTATAKKHFQNRTKNPKCAKI